MRASNVARGMDRRDEPTEVAVNSSGNQLVVHWVKSTYRQDDGERRTLAELTLDFDLSVHSFDHVAHDRKT